MTDKPDIVKNLTAFFDSKGVEGACPRCKTDKWNIHRGGFYSKIVVEDRPDQVDDLGVPLPAYFLSCANCGYVLFHLKYKVDEWEASDSKEVANERS